MAQAASTFKEQLSAAQSLQVGANPTSFPGAASFPSAYQQLQALSQLAAQAAANAAATGSSTPASQSLFHAYTAAAATQVAPCPSNDRQVERTAHLTTQAAMEALAESAAFEDQQPPTQLPTSQPALPLQPTQPRVYQKVDGKYLCTICGRTFSRSYNLRSHEKIHDTQKPFECGVCGQKFARNHDLTRHGKTHSQLKPYSCDLCGRLFARKDALRRHERMNEEGKKMHCNADPDAEPDTTEEPADLSGLLHHQQALALQAHLSELTQQIQQASAAYGAASAYSNLGMTHEQALEAVMALSGSFQEQVEAAAAAHAATLAVSSTPSLGQPVTMPADADDISGGQYDAVEVERSNDSDEGNINGI
ncbi:hypothetical protein HDU91_000774 [Kappamyces sp. JEL0680]|nr:hypothetical protein HDU91_000774 [Kappamyces sp. JEL0680]